MFPGMNSLMGMPPQQPQTPQGGLLGNFQGMDPQKMGLLAAAFQGLQASGPSRTPVSLGQTIGQAGQAGMEAMRQGSQDQMKQAMFGQQQQLQNVQMQKYMADLQKAQREQQGADEYIATLPADQQPMARANLPEYMKESAPKTVGRSIIDPRTGKVLGVDETWREEQQGNREQRMQELQMRLSDQRLQAEERLKMQRELAQMRMDGQREMRALAGSLRQPPAPQILQTENGPMVMDRGGNARPVIGPDGQPVKGKSTDKALPTSAAQKLMENQQNLRRAQEALSLIEGRNVGAGIGDKNATGLKGYLPDAMLQRFDPEGIDTRARISDLGSLVIHDRSGAAVTAAEFPRLRPFIPAATDDPETVKKKLRGFVREYGNAVGEAVDFYKESGYKVPDGALRSGGGQARTVVKRGMYQGKKVVQYSDGSTEYE